MKLRLPNKLIAAIMAAASPVLFQTLSTATLGAAAVAVMAGQQVMGDNINITTDTQWAFDVTGHENDVITINSGKQLQIGNNTLSDASWVQTHDYGDFVVNGTLKFHVGSKKVMTVNSDDKFVIDSAITLNNGATLLVEDGSYYFKQAITVSGNATMINRWDKTQVIDSLIGDSNAVLTLKHDKNGSNDWFVLKNANAAYRGTIRMENTGNQGNCLIVTNENALKNAALDLGNSGYSKNQLQVEASGMTLRALSGQGYIQRSSGCTSSAVDVHVTGQGEAAFEGAVGSNVNLYIDDGATQLIGSLLDLDSGSQLIFSAGSTIDLRMTGTGGTFAGYGISPDNVSGTGNGFEYRTGAAYKIVKQGSGTLTINEGTNWKVGGEAVDASAVSLNGTTATVNALTSSKGLYHVNTGEVNYTDAAALGATGYTTGDNGTLVLNGDAASAKAILRSATAGTGTLALHTTGRVELGNNEGVTFTGTLRVDNTISGADFHIGNAGTHVVDMSSLKAIELTDGASVRYDANGGIIQKVVINSGSGSWYTEDMVLQTGAEKPNLLTINEAAVNGGQLTFEGTWKSNIKLALLTGSGTLEVKSGSNAGELDKTYFAIDSLQGFSGALKLTQNHKAGISWGKPVFNQLTADINTGSGADVTISGLTVTDKESSGAVVNLAGSQKLTVNGALTVGANSTLNIGSNEAAAHLGIQNGALSGTLHLNNGDFTFGSGSSVAGSTTAAIEMAEGTTIHVGSTIINSGALTICGTGAIDVDGLTLTGTNHVARTGDNGYGTMDAVYQLVSGTAATLSEGTNITWKNGEETLSGTFDGNVLNLGTVADTNYFINEADSTVNLTTETSSVTLGGAAKNSGTTHLTLTGIGTTEAPVIIKRDEYSTAGRLNLTLEDGSVAEINTSSGSSAVVNKDLTINASTLILTGGDRLGWNSDNGTSVLTMEGTEARHAVLSVDNRQTFASTLNMNGYSEITPVQEQNEAGLELMSGSTVNAAGTDNTIAASLMLRGDSTFEVAGDLTVTGRVWTRDGGGLLTKTGVGTLTFNFANSTDARYNKFTNGLTVAAGTVNLNSKAEISQTLTVAAGATLEIGETGVVSLAGLNTASVIHNAGSLTLSGEVNLNRTLDTSIATFSEGTYGYLQSITQRVTDGTGTVTANNVTWKVGGQTADYFGLTTTTFNDGVLSMSNVSESAPKRWFMNTGEGGDFTYTGAPEQEDQQMTSILINAKTDAEGNTPTLHVETTGAPTTLTEIIVNNTTAKIDLGADAVLTKESGMLKLSNNGSAKLTGTGTYVLEAGETQLAANSGISLDENWRGVMRLSGEMNAVTFSQEDRRANANSWVELAGVFGYIHWAYTTSNAKLILTDADEETPAFKMQDSSGKTYTFTNTVKGSGTFESAIKEGTDYRNNNYEFSGDVSEWTGKFLSSSAKGAAGTKEGNTVLLFNNSATVINAAVKSTGTAKLTLMLENSSAVTMNGDITKAETAGELNIEASAPATFTGNVAADKLTISDNKSATFSAAAGKQQSIGVLSGSGALNVTGTAATETATATGGLLHITGERDNYSGVVTLSNTQTADAVGLVVEHSDVIQASVVNFDSGSGGNDTTYASSLLAFRDAEGNTIDGSVAGLVGTKGDVKAGALTINTADGGNYTYGGALNVSSLTKTGAGSQTISGTGAFTATAATVTEGSLILNHTGEAITLNTLTITGGALYYGGGSTLTATMAGSKKQDTSAAGNITATNGTISLRGADSTLLELGASGANAVVNVANNLDIEQIRLQREGTVNITDESTVTAKKLWVEESSSSAFGGTINLSDSAKLAVNMTGAWGFQMAAGKSINVADKATFTLNSANGEQLVITAKDAQQSAVIGATELVKQYTTGSAAIQISHADLLVSKTDTEWTLGHKLTDTSITNSGSGELTVSNAENTLVGVNADGGSIVVENAANSAGTLDSIKANGGDVTMKGLGDAVTANLNELFIADNRTVSMYQGSDTATEADISVSGTLTANQHATLNANLTLNNGATLAVAEGGLHMGSTLTIAEGANVNLSTDIISGLNSLTVGNGLTLFSGVDAFSIGGSSYDADTTYHASNYFNLTGVQRPWDFVVKYEANTAADGGTVSLWMETPEPATATLSLLALAALAARRKRK